MPSFSAGCFSVAGAAKYRHAIRPHLQTEPAVKIRFETTIEDIVAFNRFHCENSPMWRRQRFICSLLLPLTLTVVIEIVFLVNFNKFADDPLVVALLGMGTLFLCGLIGVPGFFFMRSRMSASVVANVRKLLAEGTNRGIIGWRDLELVNNRLIVKLELVESSYDLRAIEKVVSNDEFTFVYVSSVQAFMIPRTLYPEEEYREFVAELLDAWDNRDAPRLAAQPADEHIKKPGQ